MVARCDCHFKYVANDDSDKLFSDSTAKSFSVFSSLYLILASKTEPKQALSPIPRPVTPDCHLFLALSPPNKAIIALDCRESSSSVINCPDLKSPLSTEREGEITKFHTPLPGETLNLEDLIPEALVRLHRQAERSPRAVCALAFHCRS